MFKHILLPTDGSAQSETAIREGVRLAKDANARITGLSVSPPFHVLAMDTEMIEDTEDQYLAASQARSRTHLAQLEREAERLQQRYQRKYAEDDRVGKGAA